MCIEDYRIRLHSHVNLRVVPNSQASPLVLPADPRRVGLYYAAQGASCQVCVGAGQTGTPAIWSSTPAGSDLLFELDFVRHGPIVQQALNIYDADATPQSVLIETVVSREIDKLIQGVS